MASAGAVAANGAVPAAAVKRLAFAFAFAFADGDKIEPPAGAEAGLNRLPFTTGLGIAEPEPAPKKSFGAPAPGLLVPLSNEFDKLEVAVELLPMDDPMAGAGAAELLNKDPLNAPAVLVGGLAMPAPPPGADHVPAPIAPIALSKARFLSAEEETVPPSSLIGKG